jgi:hypothetical protein
MPPKPAEWLLRELGVTEPEEIDLEAIAYHVGARIRYRPLDGCEARIVGYGDSAIITVNTGSAPRRARFSIAHELGHWHHHRGRALACRGEECQSQNKPQPERMADAYAADLLMPDYLFRPLAQQHARLSFKVVSDLAETFKTSHTATAIRLVEGNVFPAFLVCYGLDKRRWFTRAPSVPEQWFPKGELDPSSSAFAVLFGSHIGDAAPRKVSASAWFECWEATGYEIHEQTVRSGGEVLTLLLLSDHRMLQVSPNPSRRYFR